LPFIKNALKGEEGLPYRLVGVDFRFNKNEQIKVTVSLPGNSTIE
jgi:hypothetical protein